MSGHFLDNERLADLLVQQASEGLSEADWHELDGLLIAYPEADPQALEVTAAALLLAGEWKEEPLPESVRRRLNAAAAEFIAGIPKLSQLSAAVARREAQPAASTSAGFAWFAAAASIVLAIAAWIPRLDYQYSGKVDLLSQASQLGSPPGRWRRIRLRSQEVLRLVVRCSSVSGIPRRVLQMGPV